MLVRSRAVYSAEVVPSNTTVEEGMSQSVPPNGYYRVTTENGMTVALLSPEDFAAQYEEVVITQEE